MGLVRATTQIHRQACSMKAAEVIELDARLKVKSFLYKTRQNTEKHHTAHVTAVVQASDLLFLACLIIETSCFFLFVFYIMIIKCLQSNVDFKI